jgi:MrcB-like, N-terminal domain
MHHTMAVGDGDLDNYLATSAGEFTRTVRAGFGARECAPHRTRLALASLVVDARTALGGVAGYSHRAGKDQSAQLHLRSIPADPPAEFPVGLRILVSGSGPSLPVVPWIALLDEDVTTTPTDGLYLVYLFTSRMDAVYLSMNQGATQHRRAAEADGRKGRAAEVAAIDEIAVETALLRQLLDKLRLAHRLGSIELGATRFVPRAYEAGSIAAVKYSMSNLPENAALAADLAEFAALYSRCVELKDELAANRRVRTSARSLERQVQPAVMPEFKPKDAADYVANIPASAERRGRHHEALIKEFGDAVRATGRTAFTNVHPRELVVVDRPLEWLVEAKTVGLNAEPAVRDAIGQLFTYRHFCYREVGRLDPRLLALFNAPIGEAFENLLATLDIDFVCRDRGAWRGSADALALLAQATRPH